MTDLQWARVSNDAFNVALFAYIAAMVGYFVHMSFRRGAVYTIARAVAVVGVAANLVSVVARGLAADRVPWGNMYEYSSMLALLVVVGALVVVEGVYGVRSLTGFALMFSVLTMAVAVSFLYVGPGPLVPALDSYWIKIHVQAAIWGSSLFALGGIATIAYLVVDRSERRKRAALAAQTPPPIMGGSIGLDDADARAAAEPADLEADPAEAVQTVVPRRRLVPSAAGLDRLAYRLIALAFPIWTFAVIAGAIWAQNAWGRYWGWDPKETWSFITWVIFAGYLHARATSGWKGRRAAVIALVGFTSLLVTYYAVNLFIVGLHSYAK
ncbi:MAG TPA: c-type cytochrome biogenesis protein CcsB [Actinomycetota bacterium]|nr:c-type cytochrome biogenesis protein CcsB [Actinomycetota bacterium]